MHGNTNALEIDSALARPVAPPAGRPFLAVQRIELGEVDVQNHIPAHVQSERTEDYKKGQTVVAPGLPERKIFLVLSGRFITKVLYRGTLVAVEIVEADGFFGLETLLGGPYETMVECLADGRVTSWDTDVLDTLQRSKPLMAVGFLHLALKRWKLMQERVLQFAVMNIAERIAAFIEERVAIERANNTYGPDESVSLPAFTHELTSQYIGTSREIITHYFNLFRREGYMSYSRAGMRIHDAEGLVRWVAENHRKFSEPAFLKPPIGGNAEDADSAEQ